MEKKVQTTSQLKAGDSSPWPVPRKSKYGFTLYPAYRNEGNGKVRLIWVSIPGSD